ncbi:MAG: efflux RND transporter periplasmic adaptor subunit [Alphaproteobacteria bacterium]
MKKTVIILLILALTVAFGWRIYNLSAPKEKPGDGPVLVRVTAVQRKDVPLEVSAVGTIVPYQTVAVRARLDSRIDKALVHGGDSVKEGDLLFSLDDRSLRAQISEAEANVARDRAQEQNLRIQHEREESLNKKGFQTQSNVDQAKAAWEAQTATADSSAAALQNLQVQLQYAQIHAPISGRIGTVSVTVGNNVKANDTQPIVTINQIRPVWAQVSLPQRDIAILRAAMAKGAVSALAKHEGGAAETGKLDYLDNAVDETTGTIAARVLFDNTAEVLWPGMFVDVTLTLGVEKQAVTVPEVAVQHGPDGDFVFAIADGKAARRFVKVGRMAGGEAVIREGLSGDEQVAVDGLMKLEDGSAVKISPQDKT